MQITQCSDLTPTLLYNLLQDVTGVTLISSRDATIRKPPLGTVGGAGNLQFVVEHAFRLHGLRSTALLKTVKASRRFPLTWRLASQGEQKIAVFGWRINHDEPTLTILAQPSSAAPLTLTAALQGGQTFRWLIKEATP